MQNQQKEAIQNPITKNEISIDSQSTLENQPKRLRPNITAEAILKAKSDLEFTCQKIKKIAETKLDNEQYPDSD